MSEVKLSICASAIRTSNWENVLNSLRNNNIKYEVIFVGDTPPLFDIRKYPEFIYTYSTTKPAQCYNIAFQASKGEYIFWTADDATYNEKALDNMYSFLESFNNYKIVGAFRAIENGSDITHIHRLVGNDENTPIMAPFGVISRKLYEEIGGYDRNFICGQSENDLVMRVYEVGGEVKICPNAIAIAEHKKIHNNITTFRQEFYSLDRIVLERAWLDENRKVSAKRRVPFEPFEEKDILTKTQGEYHGKWQ